MSKAHRREQVASNMVTFYHDIEQDLSSNAKREECRQVVKEFLELEKEYGVPATYNVVGKLYEEQPDLIRWILDSGQEVAFHSYNHQPDWKLEYYSDEIKLCSQLSSAPNGYRSPESKWDQSTLETLWDNGFLWNAEGDRHEEPYFIHEGLVRLPIAGDDWSLHTGALTIDEWVQRFVDLLKRRPYFGFGAHDFITSLNPKERLKAWEKVLQAAVEREVLLVNFSEAADLFRRAELARYYSTAAKRWNRGTTTLYRTKRFQELIRAEGEKLNRPVVADLGSAGGVLSSDLRNVARRIYLVDNAPGMIADIDADSLIEACLGEATDSGLPDDLCDFVICARIVEYLFWPDQLADEIKRIGKIGATYLVTFPAFRGAPPSREESAPGKVRRHFTADEIHEWARQIGPGRLLGIQYESAEPDGPEAEQRYRRIEESPPADEHPTNWVCIGTIENKAPSMAHGRTLPTTAFRFRLRDQRYDRVKRRFEDIGRRFPKPIRKLGKLVLYR